jgi:hypothetical protein
MRIQFRVKQFPDGSQQSNEPGVSRCYVSRFRTRTKTTHDGWRFSAIHEPGVGAMLGEWGRCWASGGDAGR